MTGTTAQYMRAWRKTDAGRAAMRVTALARAAAVVWVRKHHPQVWADIVADARTQVGLPTELTPGGYFKAKTKTRAKR